MSGNDKWARSNRKASLPDNWQKVRGRRLIMDNYLCQINGRGCTDRATEVDHMNGPNDHRLSSLQSVCETCHKAKTATESHVKKAAKRAEIRSRFQQDEGHPGLIGGKAGKVDRGMCNECSKPSVLAGSKWICPNCGSERPRNM